MRGIREWTKQAAGVFLLIAAVFLAGCFGDEQVKDSGERIYAVVDGVPMTESDLMSIVPREFQTSLTPAYRKELIREWVETELLYQEAVRLGIDREPQIARILENTRRNLLSNEILERKLAEIPEPSDDDLREFFENHEDYFILPSDEYEVRYALFDNMDDAKDFYAQVKKGVSFSDLAEKESKDPSADRGGSLGTVNEGSVEQAVWEAIVSTHDRLGLTKISSPFKVIDGYGIVIVDAIYERGTTKPFEDIRGQIRDYYMVDKRLEAREAFLDSLVTISEIEYRF